jgi:hypothetical protein
MSEKIDRRQFLTALAALGAAIVLPANPSEAEITVAWQRLLTDPWWFEVDDGGMIVEPKVSSPRVNEDVYDSVSVNWIKDTESLIDEVDQYDELRSHFEELFESHIWEQQAELEDQISELEVQLEDENPGSSEAAALSKRIAEHKKVLEALDPSEEDGWKRWIEKSGPDGIPGFKEEIEKWLQSPVNWSACDSWPEGWSGQGQALSFFRDQDFEILDALGVVIVEGEHPGSTYYAAELERPIDEANAAAARLELPFRFRRVK